MAVKIRLKRTGAKKQPSYRIVVADSRSPRDGRFIQEIGFYNPQSNPKQLKIDEEAARDWLAKGAQPTDTVRSILVNAGVLPGRATPNSKKAPSEAPIIPAEQAAVEPEDKPNDETDTNDDAATAAEQDSGTDEAAVDVEAE